VDYNKIVEEALKSYSVKGETIEFIAQSGSMVYKITADNNDIYCLKLYVSINNVLDAVWSEKAVVNSELEWISAISRDTNIVVPVPYKNIHGEYVTVIDGISCSLTKWLEGSPSGFGKPDGYIKALVANEDMDEFDDKEDAVSFITVLGKLHKHASEWTLPAGFKRPVNELDDIVMTSTYARLDSLNIDLYNKDDINVIKLAVKKAFEKKKTIEKTHMTWGLVHSDYQPSNYLVHNHEIRPIDFGGCGFNYYLADVALAIHFIAPHKREFFLDLYSKYFPLPDNYISLIETLYITSEFQILSWYLMRGYNEMDEWLPKEIGIWAKGEFNYYLNGEPFLFDKKAFYQLL